MSESVNFKAKVLTNASRELTKSNGATYVIHNVEILEGPLKGKTVVGTRTLKNAKGESKDSVSKDQQIIVYPSKEDGKWYFSISTQTITASNEDIDLLMNGVSSDVESALDSQRI